MRGIGYLWLALVLVSGTMAGCGGDRRGSTFRGPSGCTTGSLLPCQCADGRDGLATCDGERYGACVCGDETDGGSAGSDASASSDAMTFTDGGQRDATMQPDAWVFDAGGPLDSGGGRDAAPPPRDAGFPDAQPPRDSGVRRDAGFPDSGATPPDSGVPPGPCQSDSDCGAPLSVCENQQCIPGCYPGGAGALTCAVPEDCNPLTGRCDGFLFCLDDSMCNPPVSVCEILFCIPGCAQAGAQPCPQGSACNPVTGHCI